MRVVLRLKKNLRKTDKREDYSGDAPLFKPP